MLVTHKCVTSDEQTEVRPRRGETARNGNSQAVELLTCLPATRASFKKQGGGGGQTCNAELWVLPYRKTQEGSIGSPRTRPRGSVSATGDRGHSLLRD